MGAYAGVTRQYIFIDSKPGIVLDNLDIYIDAARFSTGTNTLPDLVSTKVLGTAIGSASIDTANGSILLPGGGYFAFGSTYTNIDLSDRTIQAWIYPRTSNVAGTIIDKDFDLSGGGGPNYGGWGLWTSATLNRIQYWAHGGKDKTGSTTIDSNTWTHVSVTHNIASNTIIMHVNGVYRDRFVDTTLVPKPSNTAILQIGSFRSGASRLFNGYISDVMIYNRALSNTEITQNFDATKAAYGL